MDSLAIHPDVAAALGFEADSRATISEVREAFAAAIEAVCGGKPRAQDVATAFGLHRKLGWQVWNVAYADDSLLAIRLMPSDHGMDVWIAAARRAALPSDVLERLERAPAVFRELLAKHANDRETLELLTQSQDTISDEATEQRWRKQAFNGNSFVFGVRAKALLSAAFLHPSARPHYFDMVRVQGLIGFMRTRPNVRWPFAQSIVQSGADDHQRLPHREALMPSPDVPGGAVPLMREFCSQPPPAVQRRIGDSGLLEDEVLPGPVGQTGECTVVTGELIREVAPTYRTHDDEVAMFATGVRTPGELLICDHFVHRDLFPGVSRELRVYSELASTISRDERDRLPASEKLLHLGRGLGRVRTAELPRYGDILNYVFQRTGWRADEFDVFRIRMGYPPIPVSVMVRHDMPAPPAAIAR